MPPDVIPERFAERVASISPDEDLFSGLLRQVQDPAALVRLYARAEAHGPEKHVALVAAELARRGIGGA